MGLDIDLALLLKLILSHFLHFNEGLVHELAHVVDFEQDLGLRGSVHELDQLNEDSLDVADFFEVTVEAVLESNEPLVFCFVLVFKV